MPVTIQIEPLVVSKATAAAMLADLGVTTFEELSRTEPLLQPRQISKRRVGYLVDDLRKWAASRPVSDQLPPPDSGYGRNGKNVEGNRTPRTASA
jgi:hypothetical protein